MRKKIHTGLKAKKIKADVRESLSVLRKKQKRIRGKSIEKWKFRLQVEDTVVSFILGIQKSKQKSRGYIHVISNELDERLHFKYPSQAVKCIPKYTSACIEENIFNTKGIHIDLEDKKHSIKGTVFFEPNKKGNMLQGELLINERLIDFTGGSGTIEKEKWKKHLYK